jgi:hypothetical protein
MEKWLHLENWQKLVRVGGISCESLYNIGKASKAKENLTKAVEKFYLFCKTWKLLAQAG